MRYLFRGLIRETGRPVEGHVNAPNQKEAFNVLADNGIVTESLRPDPKPLNRNRNEPGGFSDALDSAFDASATQVSFDDLTERYRGKRVWVIDRDKIRQRVAQVVDEALAQSHKHEEGSAQTRQRVAHAIHGMFADNRNIASERDAEAVAREQREQAAAKRAAATPPAVPAGTGATGVTHPGLEQQITRLANLVRQAENALASITMAARRFGSGGGGGRRFVPRHVPDEPQNEVLLEIFKSNLDLVRSLENGAGSATDGETKPPPN